MIWERKDNIYAEAFFLPYSVYQTNDEDRAGTHRPGWIHALNDKFDGGLYQTINFNDNHKLNYWFNKKKTNISGEKNRELAHLDAGSDVSFITESMKTEENEYLYISNSYGTEFCYILENCSNLWLNSINSDLLLGLYNGVSNTFYDLFFIKGDSDYSFNSNYTIDLGDNGKRYLIAINFIKKNSTTLEATLYQYAPKSTSLVNKITRTLTFSEDVMSNEYFGPGFRAISGISAKHIYSHMLWYSVKLTEEDLEELAGRAVILTNKNQILTRQFCEECLYPHYGFDISGNVFTEEIIEQDNIANKIVKGSSDGKIKIYSSEFIEY